MPNIKKVKRLLNEIDKLSGNKVSDISERKGFPEENELRTLQEQIKEICQREDIKAELDELKAQLDEERDICQSIDTPVCIEWKEDITKYFVRQIDIWLKYFAKRDKIEEIKLFIADYSSYIGMELLIDGIWDQLCFSNYEWQVKYLEHADWKIRDDVKGSAFLDELWIGFCDEADDEEKSRMISYIVLELQERYGCKVTAAREKIQLKE